MPGKGISTARLAGALKKHAGIISLAAQEIGTSYQNVYQRITRSTELQALMAEIDNRALDLAEATVMNAMRGGDAPTARWYLDRKGRRRGYGSHSTSVTVEGGTSEGGATSTTTIIFKGDEAEF